MIAFYGFSNMFTFRYVFKFALLYPMMCLFLLCSLEIFLSSLYHMFFLFTRIINLFFYISLINMSAEIAIYTDKINKWLDVFKSDKSKNVADLFVLFLELYKRQWPEGFKPKYGDYNLFYKFDNAIKLGYGTGEDLQERILTIYHIMGTLYELTDNISVQAFTNYNGKWIENKNSLPFSNQIFIFSNMNNAVKLNCVHFIPTVIYDTRDVNLSDYSEGITLANYLDNHTEDELDEELYDAENKPTTHNNYFVECLKITKHLMKNNIENTIYLAKGFIKAKQEMKDIDILLFGDICINKKFSCLISPDDFSLSALLALSSVNSKIFPPLS